MWRRVWWLDDSTFLITSLVSGKQLQRSLYHHFFFPVMTFPSASHISPNLMLPQLTVSCCKKSWSHWLFTGGVTGKSAQLRATAAWVAVYPVCLSADIQHSSHFNTPTVHLSPVSAQTLAILQANPCSSKNNYHSYLFFFFFFTAFDFDNPNFRSFCSFHIAPWSVFQVVLALRSAMFLTPPLSCITKPLVSIHHFQPPRCTVPQASIALISARLYVCWGFPCNFPFPKQTPALLPPNTQTFPTEKSNRKESEKNYVERKVISWKKGGWRASGSWWCS